MDREQLLSQWKGEESRGMSGWDFSHIDSRYTADPLPWDYREKVREFLRPGVRLLDMGTGGGELLLTLGHPYELTSVTEGWAPNWSCAGSVWSLWVSLSGSTTAKGACPAL